jgi:hypothetical protein
VQQVNVGSETSSEGARLKSEDSLQWLIPFQFTRSDGPFPSASVCSFQSKGSSRVIHCPHRHLAETQAASPDTNGRASGIAPRKLIERLGGGIMVAR